tara:strand:+ start:3761 stop:4252 length:492 start_codon:yes stop_codon:yes gene_type:complete
MLSFFFFLIILFLLYKLFRVQEYSSDQVEVKERFPYHLKQFFFSRSEQEFFNILNAHLDAHRYTVFPKVRLGDFVQVDSEEYRNRKWWNMIRAKHVDFLIWDLVERKIVLAIEVDGKSHNSEKMIKRDEFVNDLYKQVGLDLKRVKVGVSFEKVCSEISSSLS